MTKDEALDLALEALEYFTDTSVSSMDHAMAEDAITAIKQARSAPEELVAFNAGVPLLYPEMKDGETISVEYTTPPAAQRQWVNLTDEERDDISEDWATDVLLDIFEVISAIEAKLKEKNNG